MRSSVDLDYLAALRLPSLNLLKTFTVVAQTLNLTRAADLLHITQGAVSRQIAALEASLGYPLFVRHARGLLLTAQGSQLLPAIEHAFAKMGEALQRVAAHPNTLRVKCPTCAMRWMLPRVIQLQNIRPEMRIELTATVAHGGDFSSEQFDAAVVFGHPAEIQRAENGRQSVHLFDEVLTPVCSPALPLPDAQQHTQKRLEGQTLLHPTRDHRDWLLWLRESGVAGLPACKSQHFDTLDQAINLALQGYGVAIGDLTLIEDDLSANRVVTPFALCVASGASYRLHYPKDASPALQLAIGFFQQQAQLSRQQLDRLLLPPRRLVTVS
jgi:LysR family glycine cleavage system transcriptional activator